MATLVHRKPNSLVLCGQRMRETGSEIPLGLKELRNRFLPRGEEPGQAQGPASGLLALHGLWGQPPGLMTTLCSSFSLPGKSKAALLELSPRKGLALLPMRKLSLF